MSKLDGKNVQIFTGSGFQLCTIESGMKGSAPFRARSQRNGFTVGFDATMAKRLHKGTAPNMKLI